MNARFVAILAAIVVSFVGLLAGEDGPIDRLTTSPGATAEPDAAAKRVAKETSASNAAADFFSLQDEDDGWAQAQFDPVRAPGALPVRRASVHRPTSGALSKEQLNVEVPVGLASMRTPIEDDS